MLKDSDPMPFGKHKGKPMIEVPRNWLLWLYDEINASGYLGAFPAQTAVYAYISDNLEAIQKERDVFETEDKREGFIVLTKTGYKGIIYNDEAREGGKNKTYIVDANLKPTGLKMLCDPMTQQIIGFIN